MELIYSYYGITSSKITSITVHLKIINVDDNMYFHNPDARGPSFYYACNDDKCASCAKTSYYQLA